MKTISNDQKILFHRQQNEILPDIGSELIALIPEHWESAVLELEMQEEGLGHSIFSEDGHRDIVTPSTELFVPTRKLELLFEKFDCMWKKARFQIWIDGDGQWEFKVDYEYPA